jgi:tRNA(adenine34) deaminase
LKNKQVRDDAYFMLQALKEASKAQESQEVPVGAVIVKDGKIIARGFNKCIALSDPTAHAEIIALRKAAKKLKNYRLNDCCLYATIEPCAMCAGALVNARIKKIIFGAFDKKVGYCGNVLKTADTKKPNCRIEIDGGREEYLSRECADIIKFFFKKVRQQKHKSIKII